MEVIGTKYGGAPLTRVRWEPDPDVAPRVVQAFQMAADGATYDDIVAATGICSNKSSLATILANPIYRGLRVFNRETRAEGEHGRKRRRNPDDQLVISQVEESRPASSPYCRTAGRVGHSLPEGVAPAVGLEPTTWRLTAARSTD